MAHGKLDVPSVLPIDNSPHERKSPSQGDFPIHFDCWPMQFDLTFLRLTLRLIDVCGGVLQLLTVRSLEK